MQVLWLSVLIHKGCVYCILFIKHIAILLFRQPTDKQMGKPCAFGAAFCENRNYSDEFFSEM